MIDAERVSAVLHVVEVFANYAVPTAIIICLLIGVRWPPGWVTKHFDRRTKAYEESQKSIAASVAQMHNAYFETRSMIAETQATTLASIQRIETFCHAIAKLREEDNAQQATVVEQCRIAAEQCSRIATAIEPRRHIFSADERARRRSREDSFHPGDDPSKGKDSA